MTTARQHASGSGTSVPSTRGTPSSPYPATLWQALAGYPVLFAVLFLAQRPSRSTTSPRRAAHRALKLVSATHATLTTVLASRDVLDAKWQSLNLITTRSPYANSIVGLEAGYLLQDTLISKLLDSSWSPVYLYATAASNARIRFDTLMVTHHVTLAPLLLLFLEFARRGKERGVFFVEMFLIMNASTPLLNLRWWLADLAKTTTPKSAALAQLRKASAVNDAALVATFFTCRIGLIFYMLHLYGRRTGRSIIRSYLSIPLQCKSGTAALLILNTLWWLSLVQRTVQRRKQAKV